MPSDPTSTSKTPESREHEAHELNRLERGRALTDAEIACYIADHQTALRHGTARVGDEIAEHLRDRLRDVNEAATPPPTHEPPRRERPVSDETPDERLARAFVDSASGSAGMSEPRKDPLTAKEVATIRAGWANGPEAYTYNAGRWIATLDAAREQAATEARRELDVDVLATAMWNVLYPDPAAREANDNAYAIAAEYRRLIENSDA